MAAPRCDPMVHSLLKERPPPQQSFIALHRAPVLGDYLHELHANAAIKRGARNAEDLPFLRYEFTEHPV